MKKDLHTVSFLFRKYLDDLAEHYPKREARQLLYIVFDYFLGLSKTKVITEGARLLGASEQKKISMAITLLKEYRPVQYITGETTFCDIKVNVNESVLIPRPETEELVYWIIGEKSYHYKRILDIGTGSGIIGIALKKHYPEAEITAIDVSEAALSLARENAFMNNVDIDFQLMDFLDWETWKTLGGDFDLIVSNPPYVTESEKKLMKRNILDYEPHQALFVPDNEPVKFYSAIARFAIRSLIKGGHIYLEINEARAAEVEHVFASGFSNIAIRKDLSGRERMVRIVRTLN